MLVPTAATFATEAHGSINQRRKYTNEPYIVHPAAVARMVAAVTADEAMIAAAWLHDVVEDTPVTLATIHDYFGTDVATLVNELTDVTTLADGNRKVRKQMELEHTRQASPRAKTVKLADFIDNARSICEHDKKFAPTFMQEMEQFLAVLTEGDDALYAIALDMVLEYKKDKTTLEERLSMDSAQMLDLTMGSRRAFSKTAIISLHHIASNLAFDDAMRAYVHPYFGELVIGPLGCFLHTGSLAEYEIPLKDLADEDALMTWIRVTCAVGG